MSPSKSTPGVLQQQPRRDSDPQQQQQSGSGQAKEGSQQMGEGSYEGARDYKQRTADYLKKADVEADAEAAKPRSRQEASDMEQAEKEAKSHSKGER